MNWGQFIGRQLMEAASESTRPVRTPEIQTVRKHFEVIGRAGGLKGGIARAINLSPERRSEIARMGGIARREKLKAQG